MHGLNTTVVRFALVVPLVFEVYRLLGIVARQQSRPLDILSGSAVWGLPALGLVLACCLVFAAPRGRRLWYIVAASGLWLMFVDFYSWHGIVAPAWRPSVEFALGLYAALLALAFLLRGASSRAAGLSAPLNGRAGS